MKKIIATIVLKLMGWKIQMDGDAKNLDRCILAVAPHTANIEYILGNLAYWKLGKPLRVIIKDAHTKAWYGFIIKAMGGIGIDRSQKNNLVQFVADLFKKEDFSLVITPEGTRSWVPKWKLGFYHIGKKISVEDLETRSFESIMDELEEYYKNFTPKYPEKWNPKIY